MTEPIADGATRGSLRFRLLAGTLFWIAVSIVAAGWSLGSLFRAHVDAQFHAELTTHLDQLAANLALDAGGRPVLSLPLSDPRLERPYSGCYWQVDAVAGTAGLLRSRSLWDGVLAVPDDTPADGEIHRHRIDGPGGARLRAVERVMRLDDARPGEARVLRLIAASDEALMEEPIARFENALWIALGALAAGLVLAAVMQVVVGLAPLNRLRAALAAVHGGSAQRLEGRFPAEVMPLVDEFNRVLAQKAEVVERARTQAGNLAHALKTPLSVLANAADTALAARDGHELAGLVREQVDTARRQVDYHLARAQSAAAAMQSASSRTALGPVIDGLMRAMQRLHADRELDLVVQPLAATLAFRGDAQDLQEMLGNLIDNACKWAAHRVEVSAVAQADRLVVTVDDDGRGLPREQRDAMLQRGMRADEEVPGSGLGLAIVDDLARLYGGEVALGESPLGGLRAELSLPRVAQGPEPAAAGA